MSYLKQKHLSSHMSSLSECLLRFKNVLFNIDLYVVKIQQKIVLSKTSNELIAKRQHLYVPAGKTILQKNPKNPTNIHNAVTLWFPYITRRIVVIHAPIASPITMYFMCTNLEMRMPLNLPLRWQNQNIDCKFVASSFVNCKSPSTAKENKYLPGMYTE